METGKLIRELRIGKGMTQEELAFKTEVSARTIQRIENGEVDPRAYTLQMIAKALDVDYSLFLQKDVAGSEEIRRVDDNNRVGLLYLSGILPLILPAYLIWKRNKENIEDLTKHYRVSVGFQLRVLAALLASAWIYWKAGQPIPLIGVLAVNTILSLLFAAKAVAGKPLIIK